MAPTRLWLTFVLLLASAQAQARPAWVDKPPENDGAFVFAVGEGQAGTRAEAEKAALSDALGKLAADVSVMVSATTIDTQSSRETDSNVFVETKSSARGLVRDAAPVGEPWVAISRGGFWPFRQKETFTVKVLLRWPRASLERERQRQASAWQAYRDGMDGLARKVVASLRKSGLPGPVAVGGFREATTSRAYTFSQILKRDLSDSLVRSGIGVMGVQKAKVAVGGVYRVVGNDVVITARVVRVDSGESVGAADVAIDRALLEPAWLEDSRPLEPFFEGLEPESADVGARVGAISVTSRPDGAQIFVDGVARGRTPASFGGIPVGMRSLTVVADEHEPFIAQVRVLQGETTPIAASLVPKTGNLEIRSRPSGADVVINGQSRGRTPLRLYTLKTGAYDVRLTLKDYNDASVQMKVEHNKTASKDVVLTEQPGGLFVITDPPGATVSIDGVEVGRATAPKFLKIDGVPAGLRQVEALLPGRGAWRGVARVQAHAVTTVTAAIEDQRGSLRLSVLPQDAQIFVDEEDWTQRSTDLTEKSQVVPDAGEQAEGDTIKAMQKRLLDSIDAPPRLMSIDLVQGAHDVRAAAPGYAGWQKRVTIKSGAISRLNVDLQPQSTSSISAVAGKKDWGDVAAGTSLVLVPGVPFLLWNDENNLMGWGTILCVTTMGVEAAALAHGQYAAAGAIHGSALLLGFIGFEVKISDQKVSVTGGNGVEVAWSRRF